MENEPEVQVGTRVSKSTYAKIQERQKRAKEMTGIEPSVSAVVRVLLEEATAGNGRKR